MIFRQVLHQDLGCASYLLADDGEAVVIDPKWEFEEYLTIADEHRVRITHILETHTHADHVSGRGLLATATNATIYLSEQAAVRFPFRPLADGQVIRIGKVEIQAIETPGHRPEHLAFLVADHRRGEDPWLLLAGDSLLVGDVARPDLAIGLSEGAADLFRSLRRLADLSDSVELWPGHIGGSSCGSATVNPKSSSTLGFERRHNPLLSRDETAFTAELLARLPAKPANFERIIDLNRGRLIKTRSPVTRLSPQHVARLLEQGAVIVDGRSPGEFASEHVLGSVNVPVERWAVGTRACWTLAPDTPVVLNATREGASRRMARMLEAVGFSNILGLLAGGLDAWKRLGFPLRETPSVEIRELARGLRSGAYRLLDVRDEEEWRAGHVTDALHVPCSELRFQTPAALPTETQFVVACATGSRSALAASVLERAGRTDVVRLADAGVSDLADYGFELSAA